MKNIKTYKELFENQFINETFDIILDFRKEYPTGVDFIKKDYDVDVIQCLDIIKKSTAKQNIFLVTDEFYGGLALKITKKYSGHYVVHTISSPESYVFNSIYPIVTIDEFIKIGDLDRLFKRIKKIKKSSKFNL